MNILQCVLIISALAPLFVTGPNLVPVQSYATVDTNGDNEITKDYKDSIHKDINTEPYISNQHSSQDNLCYRDDGCEQANEGEQAEGKDNAAGGFNDQSKNNQQQEQPAWIPTPTLIEGKREKTASTSLSSNSRWCLIMSCRH
jgi:hypothetical protein